MRAMAGTMAMALVLIMGGCGSKAEKAAAADAKAAGFVPPSVITRVDYGTLQDRRFGRLDRDGDDVITKVELPRVDSPLLALDRNHDGEITSSEFGEGQMSRFDAMDRNRDGSLTADERVASAAP